MIKTGDDEEKAAVCQAIWTLSFDDSVKQKILDEPECVENIEKLTEHEHKQVKKSAKGAMWKLKKEEAHGKKRDEEKGKEKESEDGKFSTLMDYSDIASKHT